MLQPYQEQGMKDKERYTRELQEYREKLQSEEGDAASLEPVTTSVQGHMKPAEEEEAVVDADDGLEDIARYSACNATQVDYVSNEITDGCLGIQTSGDTKLLLN